MRRFPRPWRARHALVIAWLSVLGVLSHFLSSVSLHFALLSCHVFCTSLFLCPPPPITVSVFDLLSCIPNSQPSVIVLIRPPHDHHAHG